MSGGFVAYNQRPNKAVERHLFIDLLMRLNRMFPIQEYTYVGFGGPFLEDFKLIHSYFDNKEMICIEIDAEVHKRQKFNLPYTCIDLECTSSGTFINEYYPAKNCIMWLDYAAANQYLAQLSEFHEFLVKALVGDIVKITLNANYRSLRSGDPINPKTGKRFTDEELSPRRLNTIKQIIGDYKPYEPTEKDISKYGFPLFLNHAIEKAASMALSQRLDHGEVTFEPLTCFTYADSMHQMMTLTGVLIEKKRVKELESSCGLKSWSLAALEWGKLQKIAIPNLSQKEKTFIDQSMPGTSAEELKEQLKFNVDPDDDMNLEYLDGYIKYYRYFPSFHRVLF